MITPLSSSDRARLTRKATAHAHALRAQALQQVWQVIVQQLARLMQRRRTASPANPAVHHQQQA